MGIPLSEGGYFVTYPKHPFLSDFTDFNQKIREIIAKWAFLLMKEGILLTPQTPFSL